MSFHWETIFTTTLQESAMSYGMWLGIQSLSDHFHLYTICGGFLYWETHDYYGGPKSIESQIEMTKYCKNWTMPGKNYYSYDKETSSYHILLIRSKYAQNYMKQPDRLHASRYCQESLMQLEQMLIDANQLKCRWIFVFGHYHIFSNGYYGNYDMMIERVLPLLKKNVSVYFSK